MTIDIIELTKTIKQLEIEAKKGRDLKEWVSIELVEINKYLIAINESLQKLNPLIDINFQKINRVKPSRQFSKITQLANSIFLALREDESLRLSIKDIMKRYECSYKTASDITIILRRNPEIKLDWINRKSFRLFYQRVAEHSYSGEISEKIKQQDTQAFSIVEETKKDDDELFESMPKKFNYLK